jgi:hypothetical protein
MIRRKFRLLVLLASVWLLGICVYFYKASQDHVSLAFYFFSHFQNVLFTLCFSSTPLSLPLSITLDSVSAADILELRANSYLREART